MHRRMVVLTDVPIHKDPRIDWVCQLAVAQGLNVHVIGIGTEQPNLDQEIPYTAETLPQLPWKNFQYRPSFLRSSWRIAKHTRISLLMEIMPVAIFVLIRNSSHRLIKKLDKLIFRGIRKIFFKKMRNASANDPFAYYKNFDFFASYLFHIYPEIAFTHWEALHQLPGVPDILYCADLTTLFTGVAFKLKHPNLKLIYDAHEFWSHAFPETPRGFVKCFEWLEKALIRHTDFAMTVSPPLAETMQAILSFKPIACIPNCTPYEPQSGPIIETEMTRLAAGRVKFLFQGGLHPLRGLEELLTAWQWIPKERAALFIRCPESPMKNELIELSKHLGLFNESVYFPEPVTEAELVSSAREADIGVITYLPDILNHLYACPNKLSQYMQAGLMLLTTRLVYIDEVLKQYNCGITYDGHQLESLTQAILYILDHPEAVQTCKENAAYYSKHEFNWEIQSLPLAKLFREYSAASISENVYQREALKS